ncbi:MAG: hypothetical protein ABIQ93_05370 [Saprospiraceae bacterium]
MENLDDELRDISPLLRDLKRPGDGLRTPEGYFDDLEDQVFGRLEAMGSRRPAPGWQATRGGQWIHRLLRPRVLTAIAAGLALLVAAFWFFKSRSVLEQSSTLAQVTLPELSEEDIETYVLENVYEFDTEQLAALPPAESADPGIEPPAPNPAQHRSKRQQALDDLHPEDLDNLLNELSDEDLEKLL